MGGEEGGWMKGLGGGELRVVNLMIGWLSGLLIVCLSDLFMFEI